MDKSESTEDNIEEVPRINANRPISPEVSDPVTDTAMTSDPAPIEKRKSRVELVVESINDLINFFVPPVNVEMDANSNPPGPHTKEQHRKSDIRLQANVNKMVTIPTTSKLSAPVLQGPPVRRMSPLKTNTSPFQRKPTEDQVLIYIQIFGRIFSYLRARDVIAARRVCRNWYTFSTRAFRSTTAFVFNPCLDSGSTAAAVLTPWRTHSSSNFITYVQTSLNKLAIWNTLVIHQATTDDLQLIMTSWPVGFLEDLFNSIETLDLVNCSVEWDTLFGFLTHFKSLQSLSVSKGSYFQGVPLPVVLIQTLTGGTESPRTRNMEMTQDDVLEFRKYPLSFKKLRVEDAYLGMTAAVMLALMKEALPPNSLEELEVAPGGERAVDNPDTVKDTKEFTLFWISLAEILFHSRDSLQKLTVTCIHDQAPRKAFDFFVTSCIEYFNKVKGQFDLTALTDLTLDFNFVWLSSDEVEREFVPFIQTLPSLRSLQLKTIVMRPIADDRLHLLFDPMLRGVVDPNNPRVIHLVHPGVIELGLHLTDLEGSEVVPEVTIAMQDPLYQEMRSLTISIHSRRTTELREFWTRNDRLAFPNMTTLNVAIMNPYFLSLNMESMVKKFSGLTELTVVDGPRLTGIGGHMAVRPENLYQHMSQVKFGNAEFQLVLDSYPCLRHLTLQLNLSTLTDSGLTGIGQASINRLTRHRDFLLHEPEYEIVGRTLAEMKELETLVLRGLGEWVTDIAAMFGFEKLSRLRTLVLYGKQRLTKPIRQHLLNWGKTKECFVQIMGFGYKTCEQDGTWFRRQDNNRTWSNYTNCVDLEDLEWRRIVITLYESGYLISVCALIFSLIIFCSFKCLACTRVRIHKHLFVSFIISNVLWMAFYRLVVDSPDVLLRSPLWCKTLHVFVHYFMVANYFWMFCEGFYLHTILVLAFIRSDTTLLRSFYLFGWIGPLVPTGLYGFYRSQDEDKNQACWIEDSNWNYMLSIPVCLSLVLSLGFLVNILRVLVRKLKDNQRHFSNVCRRNSSIGAMMDNHLSLRKAVRATLILIPLLGLHYLLIPFRPSHGTSEALVYDVVAAAVASLQGFCVSLLFCFCNSEVLMVFRRKLSQRHRIPKSPRESFHPENSCAPTSMSIMVSRKASELFSEDQPM